ncbi:probable RNA-binding protein 18 [Anopheles arabiensis]|uniref:probable RNA-binding protein 18 n=1 Tax=Anopheles arabiensis TaxID=7173 RepID=UPI001AADEC50|nr:probable RNA-binding protein 18 [Anopheles arabiensis]XP_061511750.1 probable RNA-binding protein 18 [Anopheles gambiae]
MDRLEPSSQDDRRLWLGNLDSRITEYQLLKIVQKYGKIEKFDMLFHRSGPLAGYPRGYAFVTYENHRDSESALHRLDGKLVGEKTIVVRWAKHVNREENDRSKPKIEIPCLAGGSKGGSNGPLSQQTKIQALEAKLKMLESRSDDLVINRSTTAERPIIERYQYNIHQPQRMDPKTKRPLHEGGSRGRGGRGGNRSAPYRHTNRHK